MDKPISCINRVSGVPQRPVQRYYCRVKYPMQCPFEERLSLCMNNDEKFRNEHFPCEQATFIVQEGRLSWKSIGKELIENITSAPSDRKRTGMRNDDADREKKDWDEERVKVDFPSVQISGNQEKGGFNDLLANEVFKEHNFMRQKKTMDSDHDIVLTSRKNFPRGLAILLTIVTVPMFAARVCSFCCRTRFEQYIKRPVHFALFGTLHLALSVGYFAIISINDNLDVMRNSGSAVVERYPATLGCVGHIGVPLSIPYILGVCEKLDRRGYLAFRKGLLPVHGRPSCERTDSTAGRDGPSQPAACRNCPSCSAYRGVQH